MENDQHVESGTYEYKKYLAGEIPPRGWYWKLSPQTKKLSVTPMAGGQEILEGYTLIGPLPLPSIGSSFARSGAQ
jgi:hypothetical protein